jgi:hypothetical protein
MPSGEWTDGAFPVLDPRGFYSTSGECSVSPLDGDREKILSAITVWRRPPIDLYNKIGPPAEVDWSNHFVLAQGERALQRIARDLVLA